MSSNVDLGGPDRWPPWRAEGRVHRHTHAHTCSHQTHTCAHTRSQSGAARCLRPGRHHGVVLYFEILPWHRAPYLTAHLRSFRQSRLPQEESGAWKVPSSEPLR